MVSIIITTHNRINKLKRAIESVRAQTYPIKECIVVNDASTDETEEWLEKNKKHLNLTVLHIRNSKGGNHARNQGILRSHGDIIAFLDDDDFWEPTKIEKQVEILRNKEKIGLVYCAYYDYFGSNIIIKRTPPNNNRGDMSKEVFSCIFCTTSMIMIRRDILFQVGLFDENLRYWQEYDLLIRVSQVTQIDFVSEPLMYLTKEISDKVRLSNNINGWIDAVKYINNKYADLISAVPEEIKAQRKEMILMDAAARYARIGDMKSHKRIKKQIFMLTHSLKDMIKWLFNITDDQLVMLKFKLKIVGE